MPKSIKNIFYRSAILFITVTFILLNVSSFIHCSNMMDENDCSYVQKTVKPCCMKKMKITTSERISSACACEMKESQHPDDFYIDLSSNYYKTYQTGSKDYEQDSLNDTYTSRKIPSVNYSPPILSGGEVYLSNLNLRI